MWIKYYCAGGSVWLSPSYPKRGWREIKTNDEPLTKLGLCSRVLRRVSNEPANLNFFCALSVSLHFFSCGREMKMSVNFQLDLWVSGWNIRFVGLNLNSYFFFCFLHPLAKDWSTRSRNFNIRNKKDKNRWKVVSADAGKITVTNAQWKKCSFFLSKLISMLSGIALISHLPVIWRLSGRVGGENFQRMLLSPNFRKRL